MTGCLRCLLGAGGDAELQVVSQPIQGTGIPLGARVSGCFQREEMDAVISQQSNRPVKWKRSFR